MSAQAARKHEYRWGQALACASVVVWLTYVVGAYMNQLANGRPGAAQLALVVAVLGLPLALVTSLFIGVPALLVANYLKLSRWWHAALTGGVAGVSALAFLMTAFGTVPWGTLNATLFVWLFAFGTGGACAGVAAWASLWLDGKYNRGVLKEA